MNKATTVLILILISSMLLGQYQIEKAQGESLDKLVYQEVGSTKAKVAGVGQGIGNHVAYEAHTDIPPDTILFWITESNNIVFQTILNGTDTLDMFFDTGATDLVIKQNVIDEKKYTSFESKYSFALNNLKWASLTIYPANTGPEEAHGHFGWDLFKDKVVEIDYDNQRMIVHSEYSGNLSAYSKSEIEYTNTLFCIQGEAEVNGKVYSNRYLFDLGFQRAVVMDKDLRKATHFPKNLPVIRESVLKNSAGKKFVNQVVKVEKICLGGSCAAEVPVQLLSTPNPARFETHILGCEFLKRFNTILDFQNGYVYLKPNSLMSLPYVDADGNG